jgi:PAS domain S-box-containing protein
MDYRLQDLIDIEQFQSLQDRLNRIYSFPCSIIDNEGNILTATAWQDICSKFHRQNKECEKKCIESDQYILSHLKEADPAVSYRCPHGLLDNATPIIIEGKHLGNFFTGQFFMEKPDLEFYRKQAKRYGFDERAYIEAVQKVPIWTQEQLNNYLFFIKGLIEIITSIALKNLRTIESQKKLDESEQEHRAIIQTAMDGFCLVDLQGRLLQVNAAYCRMSGYSESELLTMRIGDLDVDWSEDAIIAHIQKLITQGEDRFETRHRRKDGTIFFVEIGVKYHSINNKERIVAFLHDITSRKQAEAEKDKLATQLQQAQKMESVGRLAGGVAHDFNNMLGVILGHAEMALEKAAPAQSLHEHLAEILNAARRSAGLTRQLLAFARKQAVAPRVLNLNETIAGMIKMLERMIGEQISLNWRPGANLWPVKVDPSQIDQILANLCVNARDAISDIGRIIIETGNCVLDDAYCNAHAGFVPGEYVRIAVSDSGCGMDAEALRHVFEPFFTTKEVGLGTGLGLATVYGAVKQNNGYINVHSDLGLGTSITIYLPRCREKAVTLRVEETPAPRRDRVTTLLVEDEPAILKLATIILKRHGHNVLAASTPGEAIRLAGEYGGDINLLITDVIMPEMNGHSLAKNLQLLYPNIKILFMSGYTADVIADNNMLHESVCFMQKPFSLQDLASKVTEALGQ